MSWPLGVAPNGLRRRTASASRPAIRMATRLGSIRSASRPAEGMAVNARNTPSVAARRSTVSSSTRLARCEATASPADVSSAAARSKASARRVVGRTPKTGMPVRASVSSHCRPTRRLGAMSQRHSPRCSLRTAASDSTRRERWGARLPEAVWTAIAPFVCGTGSSIASQSVVILPPSFSDHAPIHWSGAGIRPAFNLPGPALIGPGSHWLPKPTVHRRQHRSFCQPTTDR